jgi:hypothetical protein
MKLFPHYSPSAARGYETERRFVVRADSGLLKAL